MKTTLSQIEALYWIARLGSFRAAAARLNLTQPTISLRIKALEAALGIRLFERSGRQVRLTVEAASLLPQAERMMSLAEQLTAKRAPTDPLGGQLRLGAPDAFGLICLSGLLSALARQFPALNVALTIDNSMALSRKLNSRELDMAFLADPETEAHILLEPLGVMEHAWIASPRLKLPRGIVQPEDLMGYQIFTNPDPSNLMTRVRNWFARAGLAPGQLGTCNSLSVVLRLTMAGAGVSMLPTALLTSERGAGALRVLRARPEVPGSRLFAAYQVEKSGRGVAVVLDIARRVVARSRFVAPVSEPRPG
jgi:DNA-binding transcriptional LysR family regulator